MAKQIERSVFVQDVQGGMSKKDVATKHGIPVSIAAKFTKDLGLKFKREITPKYELVDSTSETEQA